MYRLNVLTTNIWENFVKTVPSDIDDIDIELKQYNAKNIDGTAYIEFDTEEDAMAFKLRWL